MKNRIDKPLIILLDRIFGFLLIGFFGFTAGCMLFIKFGRYTWPAYWSVSKYFLIALAVIISAKLILDISRR